MEALEARSLLSGFQIEQPSFIVLPSPDSRPLDASQPYGNSPSQVRAVYNFTNVSYGGVAGDGSGQTIAIIDAFNQPNIVSDLQAFDARFNLPAPPSFRILAQDGSSNLPSNAAPGGWGVEITLDVEWVHAMAPGANILLVEANSAGADLFTAVNFARQQPGVSAISMSWGSSEFQGENYYDQFLTTPVGHTGITFLASTGDSGSPGDYPAYSADVLAVGGTGFGQLVDSNGDYPSEVGWNLGGGGISTYENQPSYQQGVVNQSAAARTIPDVAFDAASGVSVYDSYDEGPTNPWMDVAGTSLSAACWAGLIAVADQGRVLAAMGTLADQEAMDLLYADSQANGTNSGFHDVTTGNNGFSAGLGYDLVTGLGTPIANDLVNILGGGGPPLPGTPTSLSPVSTVNTYVPTFQWSAATGAVGYELSITDSTTSTAVLTDLQVQGTTFTGLALHNGDTYTWQVFAYAGSQTGTPAQATFIVNAPVIGKPSPTAPANNAVINNALPTLQWTTVAGATGYNVQFYDASNPNAAVQFTTTASSYALTSPLANGHTYDWVVSAFQSFGGVNVSGTQSAITAFTVTIPPPPSLIAPSGSLTSQEPNFQWSAVSGASSYLLTLIDTTTGGTIDNGLIVTGTSYTPSAPLRAGDAFRWFVRSVDTAGDTSTTPLALAFSIAPGPGVPAPQSPSGSITSTTPPFRWSAVAGATAYEITILDTTGGGSTVVINALRVAGTSYSLQTPLANGHSYSWQILALNGSGLQSVWSNPLAFSVASGTISGTVFLDVNANGQLDVGEPGLAGRTVFVDLNGNGVFQSNDPYAVTDGSGHFILIVAPGRYSVRLLTFKGDKETTPVGGAYAVSLTLGQALAGDVFGLQPGSLANPVPTSATPFGPSRNPNVNTAIVKGLYNLVLGRAADSAGLTYWTGQLQAGVSVAQVTGYFYASSAYDSRVITLYYQTLLGRTGAAAEITGWVAAMQAGWTKAQVADAFISSSEFNSQAPDSAGFIQVLYGDILDRQAGAAEVAAWSQALGNGLSRSTVAAMILSSSEAAGLAVSSDYVAFLGRPAATTEVNAWVSLCGTGHVSLDGIAAMLLGSSEYYARALTSV
jgi:hypothetical protein